MSSPVLSLYTYHYFTPLHLHRCTLFSCMILRFQLSHRITPHSFPWHALLTRTLFHVTVAYLSVMAENTFLSLLISSIYTSFAFLTYKCSYSTRTLHIPYPHLFIHPSTFSYHCPALPFSLLPQPLHTFSFLACVTYNMHQSYIPPLPFKTRSTILFCFTTPSYLVIPITHNL